MKLFVNTTFRKIRQAAAVCCAVTLVAVFVTGCQKPGPQFNPYISHYGINPEFQTVSLTNRLDASLFQPPASAYTLGPGDQIEIQQMEETNSRTDLTVGPDGRIYYNLLPGMEVWGMTLPQVSDAVQKGLSQFIREPPRVGVSLHAVESRRFWILGRVQAPGVYAMTNATTLLEAIAMAGGTASFTGVRDNGGAGANEEIADLRHSFIVRKGHIIPVDFQSLILNGDLSQNIYVEPDDFIYIQAATAREVYVFGAVLTPNAIPYQQGMTMMGAISDANGTAREAYLSHVAIVRGSLTEPKVAIVNYKDVLGGKVPDVLLEPNDIVFVPFEPYRYLVRYVNLIVNTFASSTAIDGGILAVSPNVPTTTGVFIPVGSGISIVPPTH